MSGRPSVKLMNLSEAEARPVFGPAGNKSRSVELRKPILKLKSERMKRSLDAEETKGKKLPVALQLPDLESERIPSPVWKNLSNVATILRHPKQNLSLNASCSSDASSDSSYRRASTGRISCPGGTLTPPSNRKQRCGSKGEEIGNKEGNVNNVRGEIEGGVADNAVAKKRCAWVTSNSAVIKKIYNPIVMFDGKEVFVFPCGHNVMCDCVADSIETARTVASLCPPCPAARPEVTPSLVYSVAVFWIDPHLDPLCVAFHDEEWGLPVYDDKKLFELLSFSAALAELTWPFILSQRLVFRDIFLNFDPISVSKLNEKKIATAGSPACSLLSELKLRSIIENARQICKIINEFGSFGKYIWGFVNHNPITGNFRYPRQVPVKTSKADTISKDLVKRGLRGVGPTVIYSFMQSAGLTNDHLISCFRHQECIVAGHLRDKNESITYNNKGKSPEDNTMLDVVRDIDDMSLST